jgi:hypothetical protein
LFGLKGITAKTQGLFNIFISWTFLLGGAPHFAKGTVFKTAAGGASILAGCKGVARIEA